MMQVLDGLFAAKPGSHWQEQFATHQVSADVIEKYDYPLDDPQALQQSLRPGARSPEPWRDQDPGLPDLHERYPGAPAQHGTLHVGQHSEEILQDLLGYSDSEIDAIVREREQE